MKKLITAAFALSMVLSAAFISSNTATGSPFAAQAQTVSSRRRSRGIASRTYRGGRWVTRKVYRGGRWVTIRTWQAAKWTGKKSYKTGRKVVSRTKKIIS